MPIDMSSLRNDIRQLDTEDLLNLLDRAIEFIPLEQLPEFIKGYFDLDSYIIDEVHDQSLLETVQDFHNRSLAGYYYEYFAVNSKNYMDQSRGTMNFIAEYGRLSSRCISESTKSDSAQIRQAFDLLLNLLEEIDECRDDIIFFADEGGSWQIGMDWNQVLPCYFKALAAVTNAKEYAQRVVNVLNTHADYNSEEYFELALKIAKSPQKKALKAALSKE